MRADGSDQHKILAGPADGTVFSSPVWSPDGRWIAYNKYRYGAYTNEAWIELFNLERRASTKLSLSPDWSGVSSGWLMDD